MDEQGYLPLLNVLSPDQVARMRRRFDELVAAEGDRAGLEVHQEEGAQRLADLINKDALFDVCISHPRVLAAVSHVLGRFCFLFEVCDCLDDSFGCPCLSE